MSRVPTVWVAKDKELIRINESDFDQWKADGWKKATKAQVAKAFPDAGDAPAEEEAAPDAPEAGKGDGEEGEGSEGDG